MPRRPAEVSPDVPLFLIPHVIRQRIRLYGDRVERVTVKKASHHFYTVSIRTWPVKREFATEAAVERSWRK
ncbi:MAG TPA: hypothetical protein PKM50_03590 [Methanoregula sp.]|nr:hypothetical protein [Methanoregula sp.]